MPALRTTRRVAIVGGALTLAVALAACNDVQDRLDAGDRERFVEASDGFVAAFNDIQDTYVALGDGDLDVAAFVATARADIAEMSEQAAEVATVADELGGEAGELAAAAADTAEAVIAATNAIVAAIEAGDPDALELARVAQDDAIDAFNEHIETWNERYSED